MPKMENKLTEQDLELLISEKLDNDCNGLENICRYKSTPEGKKRLLQRILEMINNDGFTSIDACLAQIESQLIMDI
jgi:hypothetical protein